MTALQYRLTKTSRFCPDFDINPQNFTYLSSEFNPGESLKLRLRNLNSSQERFTLFALCGYQKLYPRSSIKIKSGNSYYRLKSLPLLETSQETRFFLNLQLTNRCNFNCKHCYNQLKTKHLRQTNLSLMTVKRLCRQFLLIPRARELKIRSVYLAGGEPFLHPQLSKIIDMIAKLRVKRLYFNDVRLGSNGLLIPKNRDLLRRARDLFSSFLVQISIDGDRKTYHKIRGKSIDIVLRALEILKDNNIKTQIGFSVSKSNLLSIEYILKLCKKYNAQPHVNPYVPFNEDLNVLKRSEWETLKLYIIGFLEKKYHGSCGWYSGTCPIGWTGTTIDPEGYIIGCPRDPEIFGHIDKNILNDKKIWRDKKQGPFLFYDRCGRFMC